MSNPVMRHVVSQFHRPRGLLGVAAGRIMSSRGSNVERNQWLIERLDLSADHRVLEIGSGPGVAIEAAGRIVTSGELVALDHSATMLAQTGARNRHLVAEGRLRLVEAAVERLPADLGRFDRIYTMNVWHFWRDQDAVVAALAERLVTGGRLTLGLQPRGGGAPDADDAVDRMTEQLDRAGLTGITADRVALRPTPAICVAGTRA